MQLQKVIDTQFGRGINKMDLMNALAEFIDHHYPTVDVSKRKYFNNHHKNEILHQLSLDIYEAGGVIRWKELLAKTIPSVGLFPKDEK
ncbi:MAG: hypothetical protein KAS32_03930 [Candidatus Peribacteraceae bacterium]|nr:hypothetical protein [Candidatus Peribacteraceae bacterium]